MSLCLICPAVSVYMLLGIQAAGFIRREVCKKVKMRRSPEFRFIADDSIEYSAGIYKMLDDLNISTADDEEE